MLFIKTVNKNRFCTIIADNSFTFLSNRSKPEISTENRYTIEIKWWRIQLWKAKFSPNDFPKNTSTGVANPRLFLGLLFNKPWTLFTDLLVRHLQPNCFQHWLGLLSALRGVSPTRCLWCSNPMKNMVLQGFWNLKVVEMGQKSWIRTLIGR